MEIGVGNRAEESHFAGGMVLDAAAGSARFSKHFDFLHDVIRDLDDHSLRDAAALAAAGYGVEKIPACGAWTKPNRVGSVRILRSAFITVPSAVVGRSCPGWVRSGSSAL